MKEYANKKTIVVCGHSQYFKKMLGMKIMMRNNDVWEVEFGFKKSENHCIWGPPRLLHRTELAQAHPWDHLVGNIVENNQQDSRVGMHEFHNSSTRPRTGADDVANDFWTDGTADHDPCARSMPNLYPK